MLALPIRLHCLFVRSALLSAALLLLIRTSAQTITNGNFESGSTGWSGCILETGTAATYGGAGSSNHVAEVDGNFSTSASDDRILCQSISGFTVGNVYQIAFDATRRGSGTPPASVSVTVKVDGGALNRTATRTGGYSMVRQHFNFTASQTTHYLTITPNFEGSFGMIFDNIAISLFASLPIELLYFNADPSEGSVALSWATASEENNAFFTVQRSLDQQDWEEVMEQEGAGSSVVTLQYGGADHKPLQGTSYYRLMQTDYDGHFSYSDITSVYEADGTTLLVFPSLAQDAATIITSNAGAERPVLLNERGQRMHVPVTGEGGRSTADVSGLPNGLYIVMVTTEGRPAFARLMVQH